MSAPFDRVTSIVEQAVLLDGGTRLLFLDNACRGDDALRCEVDVFLSDLERPVIIDRSVDEAVADLFCDNQPAMVGTRIGPYRIESRLGAGGMGEVYRATDSRLGRQVAIKTLPPALAGDPDRVARFERESKVLAALNHPHIAALYGVESGGDGGTALVLELVEGPTLAERLADGALTVDEVLALARQLADALDAAHQLGIVHRDLKPGNIKMRDDGTLKVLDFGLAKLSQPDGALVAGDPSLSPTIATPAMTTAGLILGTAAYMAPEQARGKAVDKRADIFAFGAVLYEMVTGVRAFPGDDVAETLAAIVKSEPDWTPVPVVLRPLLQRCLEKDPRRRLRDIGDAIPVLEAGGARVDAPDRTSRFPWAVAASAALIAVLAVGAVALVWRDEPALKAQITDLALAGGWQIDITRGATAPRDGSPVAVSPNGRHVAFMARNGAGASGIVIRNLETGGEEHIAGTADASPIFWKPDSSTLGFVAGGAFRKVSANGGAMSVIGPVAPGVMGGTLGATWGPDDTIVYSGRGGLKRVRVTDGVSSDAVPPFADGSEVASMPWFLPDGRHILYTASSIGALYTEPPTLYVQALGSAERRRLGTVGARNVQFANGHVLFVDADGTLMARPFDAERLMFNGEPIPVAEQIQTVAGGSYTYAVFSASDAGTLVYQAGPGISAQLTVKDRRGTTVRTIGDPAAIRAVRLSHDERRAAVVIGGQLWIYDLDSGNGQRLQLTATLNSAIWSPDDAEVAFAGLSSGATLGDLYRKDLNSASEELLLAAPDFQIPAQWLPGRLIFVQGNGPFSNNDIWVLPLTGQRRPCPLVQTTHNDTRPTLAQDGRLFAYVTDETTRPEVYVAPFPVPPNEDCPDSATFLPGRERVSTNGGTSPRWRGDGRELYYVDSAAGMLMAVSVSVTRGRVTVEPSQPLFAIATDARLAGEYDVFDDGQRFLVRVPHDAPPTLPKIVSNWTTRLRNER